MSSSAEKLRSALFSVENLCAGCPSSTLGSCGAQWEAQRLQFRVGVVCRICNVDLVSCTNLFLSPLVQKSEVGPIAVRPNAGTIYIIAWSLRARGYPTGEYS